MSSFYSDGGVTPANVNSITSLNNEATASKTAAKVSEDAAAASATASANSATASASSASSIAGSVTAAQTAETNAETAETNALASKNAANASAVAAASSETNASNSASTASGHATTSTNNAADAAKLATNAEDSQFTLSNGSTTGYSALHWNAKAEDQKTAAAASATTASTQATNSSNSATASATSATTASNKAADAQKLAVNAEDSQFTLSDGSTTGYSALHYNAKAEDEKTAAAASAATASTQATNATNQATAHTGTLNTGSSKAWALGGGTSFTPATAVAGGEYSAKQHAALSAASASTASTQATNSSNSATSSTTAKTASEAARDAALVALDTFTDQYLGVKSSAPTVDNDGDALATGSLFFDSATNTMKVYSGSAWLNAYASLSGALIATNNLSDINAAGTARTNLGVAIGSNVQAHSSVLDGTQQSFTTALKNKLDAIEASATADQTDAQIRTAVEAASDSNVFTDADHTKLNGIEASATADQSNAEIRAAVEAASDSNVFTDADHTKLNAIEASADVTDTANVVAALSAGTGIGISNAGEISVSAVALTTVQTANSQSAQLALTAQEGDVVVRSDENKSYMHNGGSAGSMSDYTLLSTPTDAVLSVNGNTGAITAAQIATAVEAASGSNTFTDADHSKLNGIEASATADQTASEVRALVESASDSNVFTDADHSKLNGIEASATADQSNAEIRAAVEAASDSNVFTDADHTKLNGIAASANNYSFPYSFATSATANAVVRYDQHGYLNASYVSITPNTVSSGITQICVETSNDAYIRHGTAAGVRSFLNVADGATNVTNTNQLTNGAGFVTSDTNTTYSAGSGLDLSGTTFSLESDLRDNIQYVGRDGNDYMHIGTTVFDWFLDGNRDMRLENDGDLHVDGNVVAYSTTTSDERLKKDIVKIDNALDKVSQLSGYTFEYIADGKKSAGVIAQEVEKVMPSAVSETTLPVKMGEDDKTEYKTVQYDQLHGLMIEAIKELKAEIEELKAR